jgi:uncharacterized membrane protein YbhN (UPF0104 family)
LHNITEFINTQSAKRSKWKNAIGLTIFLILVVMAIFLLPWQQTWNVIRTAEPKLIIYAFLLVIPINLLTALSFKIVTESQKASIPFWRIFVINLTLGFYDIVLPSTFVVSGLRWYRYSQQSQKPAQSFVTIAYYKIFNIALAIILSLGLLFFTNTTKLEGHVWQLLILLVVIISVMFSTPYLCRLLLTRLTPADKSKPINKVFLLIWNYVYKIVSALADFQKLKISTQLLVIALGIANQLTQYLGYLFISQSVGITLTYAELGTLRAVILLASNLPVNFGIGIGLREISLVAVLGALGISLEKNIAMTAVAFSRTLLLGAIGGIVELVQIVAKNIKQQDGKKNIKTHK